MDAGVFAAAKSAGAFAGRSAAQQIRHWARIGREIERAENAADLAAFDASMAEEGGNIPWAQVEAEEKLQRAARM